VVASEADVEAEASVTAKQEVNSSSYVSFHNGQIFEDGFSFSGNERNKTWINTGEDFADLSDLSGADTPNDSRAVLAADFDDDGDLDLFVHSIQRERHALYRNDALQPGEDAAFLQVRLRATTSQYEAVGALVTVHGPRGALTQVLSRGAGFVSCQVPELAFGLGANAAARVEVLWPGGVREAFGTVPANARVLLVEGSGEAQPLPRRPRPLVDPLPPGLLVEEGDALPRLAVVDRGGSPAVLDASGLAGGEPVLVNLWASYCAPCVAELPLLQERADAGELTVVALSVDVPEDRAAALALLEAAGATFPAYFLPGPGESAPDGAAVESLIDLDRLSLPTTLVLGGDGRLQTILRGPLQAEGE
jgi:thiol-disulfide isomerase/thioredoxin